MNQKETLQEKFREVMGWINIEDGTPPFGQYIVSYFNPSDKNKKWQLHIWLYQNRAIH